MLDPWQRKTRFSFETELRRYFPWRGVSCLFLEVSSDSILHGNHLAKVLPSSLSVVGAKSPVGQPAYAGTTLEGAGVWRTFTVMFLIKFCPTTKVLGFIEPLEYLPFPFIIPKALREAIKWLLLYSQRF